MRITGLTLYQAELHYAGKAYAFSQGRSYSSFLTSVVAVETDAGLTGYGEACPCGPAYAPAYAEGVLPALQLLAPGVLGRDPDWKGPGRALSSGYAEQNQREFWGRWLELLEDADDESAVS